MPLETATYISDLQATNPDGTDGKIDGDNHLRLIKSTLKTTFPAITGAVSPTHTEINQLVGANTAGFFKGLAAKADAAAFLTGLGGYLFQGRLDVYSTTQLTYQKYNGQYVTLLSGGVPKVMAIPAGGVLTGLTNAGRVADTFEYVYLYDNAGVLTGEFSATAPAYNTTLGAPVKSSDSSRLFLGVSLTDAAATTWTLSAFRVQCRSWHNPIWREYQRIGIGTYPAISAAPFIEVNDNVGVNVTRIYFPGINGMSGLNGWFDAIALRGSLGVQVTSGSGQTWYLGLAINNGASVYTPGLMTTSVNSAYYSLASNAGPISNVNSGKNYANLTTGVSAGNVTAVPGYIYSILGLYV